MIWHQQSFRRSSPDNQPSPDIMPHDIYCLWGDLPLHSWRRNGASRTAAATRSHLDRMRRDLMHILSGPGNGQLPPVRPTW
jgi:hypothetical protein